MLVMLLCLVTEPWNGFQVDLGRLETGPSLYHMFVDGEKVGSWEWNVSREDQRIVFEDISILDGRMREDAKFVIHSIADRHYEIDLQFVAGENRLVNALEWHDKSVKGSNSRTIDGVSQSNEIDHAYDKAIPRPIFLGLVPAILFDQSATMPLEFYSVINLVTWPLELKLAGEQEIEVPAGRFKTLKIELNKTGSGGISNHIFVTREPPYRVVRVDAVELNMQIKLMPS